MEIKVTFFYNLREKAGVDHIDLSIAEGTTIKDLKKMLELRFPSLRTHLNNVMILMNKQIVLDEDKVKDQSTIQFLTPVGGG